MTYTPSWTDPRTQKRLRKALGFVTSCLSTTKPRQWSTRELDRWLGYTHKPLGRYLREKLLITHDDYYEWGTDGARCKTYRLNHRGVTELTERCEFNNNNTYTNMLVPTKSIPQEWIQGTFPEIRTGAFEYQEKNHRLWHPLQNVRSDLRRNTMLVQGYIYEYDIESAAPTLIFQLAQSCGLTDRTHTPRTQEYLKNPRQWRESLAQRLGVDYDTVKQIITARFAGATTRNYRSIHEYLNWDWHKLTALRADLEFQNLSKEIQKLWHKIRTYHNRSRLSPRDKWNYYFAQERRVMRVIQRELDKHAGRYFLEHDGWRCTSWVDPYLVRQQVEKHTGYKINFQWNCLNEFNNNNIYTYMLVPTIYSQGE